MKWGEVKLKELRGRFLELFYNHPFLLPSFLSSLYSSQLIQKTGKKDLEKRKGEVKRDAIRGTLRGWKRRGLKSGSKHPRCSEHGPAPSSARQSIFRHRPLQPFFFIVFLFRQFLLITGPYVPSRHMRRTTYTFLGILHL